MKGTASSSRGHRELPPSSAASDHDARPWAWGSTTTAGAPPGPRGRVRAEGGAGPTRKLTRERHVGGRQRLLWSDPYPKLRGAALTCSILPRDIWEHIPAQLGDENKMQKIGVTS